jgi:hypothetical protein
MAIDLASNIYSGWDVIHIKESNGNVMDFVPSTSHTTTAGSSLTMTAAGDIEYTPTGLSGDFAGETFTYYGSSARTGPGKHTATINIINYPKIMVKVWLRDLAGDGWHGANVRIKDTTENTVYVSNIEALERHGLLNGAQRAMWRCATASRKGIRSNITSGYVELNVNKTYIVTLENVSSYARLSEMEIVISKAHGFNPNVDDIGDVDGINIFYSRTGEEVMAPDTENSFSPSFSCWDI